MIRWPWSSDEPARAEVVRLLRELPAIPEQRGVTVKYAEPSDKVRPKPKRRPVINLLDERWRA